ncbi:MAG: threonine synthase [Oscillospiraceae bacterium]
MNYISTRDKSLRMTAAEAIKQGLARDGGLLTPECIPTLDHGFFKDLCAMRYQDRAAAVMGLYLDDYTAEELHTFAEQAYGPSQYDTDAVAPVHTVDDSTHCLELWHGPTSAFKDMALQMLPRLLSASLRKTGEDKTACILVATSGDTGKAAMEGFADVPQTKILVFYPNGGVSAIQELQMVTQGGDNVSVCAVEGNFDDAQSGVKRIFSDEALRDTLAQRGYFLSSANSINWGRILPQIVYYLSAYCDLVRDGKLHMGQPVNFCVPTGNFGDILAAYYAKRMGLPVGKLICASNSNDVLTDFLRTGVYDRNRAFYSTMSPSMDILISSNLERLLYALSGENDVEVRGYMEQLAKTGKYQVSDAILSQLQELFWGGSCDEAQTAATIADSYQNHGYLMDTHTAVAARVLADYRAATGDGAVTVFVSTASPYKFCNHVLAAIGETPAGEGVALLEQLHQVSGVTVPRRLAELQGKPRRFDRCTEKSGMDGVVLDFLGNPARS